MLLPIPEVLRTTPAGGSPAPVPVSAFRLFEDDVEQIVHAGPSPACGVAWYVASTSERLIVVRRHVCADGADGLCLLPEYADGVAEVAFTCAEGPLESSAAPMTG